MERGGESETGEQNIEGNGPENCSVFPWLLKASTSPSGDLCGCPSSPLPSSNRQFSVPWGLGYPLRAPPEPLVSFRPPASPSLALSTIAVVPGPKDGTWLTDPLLHDLGVVSGVDGVGEPAEAEL